MSHRHTNGTTEAYYYREVPYVAWLKKGHESWKNARRIYSIPWFRKAAQEGFTAGV
jgi:hypothetical protein